MEEIKALTVTELNQMVRNVLEGHFPALWVEGELSNVSRPVSGHVYFSLKDAKAQVRCAMFRQQAQKAALDWANGQQCQIRARVSLYPGRGDYQLIVEQALPLGQGDLRLAYEALLQKLRLEGLFDPHSKKPIPSFPRQLGIITSSTGAALRDILSVLNRRFPLLPILIYPVTVQGASSAPEIVQALNQANAHALCDVLILARGGGSLEDLWSFNEEAVARAIFASHIPIISGVGHEIDFTISDFVSDVRAATPSAAAELVSPDQLSLKESLGAIETRLGFLITQELRAKAQRLDWLQKTLRHPKEQIINQRAQLARLEENLLSQLRYRLEQKQQQVGRLAQVLTSVSPLKTLGRGYAIARRTNGDILRDASQIDAGDEISVLLETGSLRCLVL